MSASETADVDEEEIVEILPDGTLAKPGTSGRNKPILLHDPKGEY